MPTDAELLELATEAAERAYTPYSDFRVGAAIVTGDGDVVTGSNIENAAYGATVCAETNAITTAAAAGVRKVDVVAVTCLDGDPCTPCGNCRQVMREFGVDRVIMRGASGEVRTMTLDQLLPRIVQLVHVLAASRQNQARFDLHQRTGHFDEVPYGIDIQFLQHIQVLEELFSNHCHGDVRDVQLVLAHQIEQQVQGAAEYVQVYAK